MDNDLEQCCECGDNFVLEDMIRVSQFDRPQRIGDWCCTKCALEVYYGIREQLIEHYMLEHEFIEGG